ncbi:hypothetical protein [Duncaniella sp.]|uniref:hypothetical protein n=1 Tax=Duncaniella sp. TaxID=2518496 RepID=UPI0023BE0C26|nr:hypothetical protein [Duncaniella sp.]MDE5904297.1 hypothetical protein [Duncaniella sp.]
MENTESLFFLMISLLLAYGVGCLGRKRKIGFGFAFALSLLNVVIGLIVVLCSKKKVEFIDINKDKI